MSDTMRTTLQVWESRISQLTERIYELREGLAVARYQSEQTPGDDALSGRVAELTAALATQEQAITVAREAQKDMSDAFLDLSHEIRHSSSPNVPSNATASIRLSAPKPFCMGDDFDIFSELFGSYVANEPFDIQLQVLKTSLSAEAYRAGRSAIIGTHRHNLGLVLEDLRALIAPKPTLASLIQKFNSCEQHVNESIALFASRVRSCGIAAYSTMNDSMEPYLVAQFLKGLKATQTLKSIIVARNPLTLNEAMDLALSVISSSPKSEICIEEVQQKPRWSMSQNKDRKRCSFCHKNGHDLNNCRMKFAIKCQLCQRNGHTAKDCWSRYQSNKGPSGPCQICNSPTHVATQCRCVKFTPQRMSDNPGFVRTYAAAELKDKSRQPTGLRYNGHSPSKYNHKTYGGPKAPNHSAAPTRNHRFERKN